MDYTLLIIIVLVAFSALFSGLNLGLMGLNLSMLKRKAKLGNKDAIIIYPLRKKGNLLLCTILLGNVAINAVLSIFLGSITTGVIAAIVATGLIVLFGEIIPQSVFSRHALALSAKAAWVMHTFVFLFYPIAKPLAAGLDRILGGELPTIFSKKELRLLLEEQSQSKQASIDKDELAILHGGLSFSDLSVKEAMTPKSNTFFVEKNAVLNETLLTEIHSQGYSRVPVVDRKTKKVVGILFVKDLITINPLDHILVKAAMRKKVPRIHETECLDNVLNRFRKERRHLFIVINKKKKVVGIITLEDVLEEIVGDIVDEYDALVEASSLSK